MVTRLVSRLSQALPTLGRRGATAVEFALLAPFLLLLLIGTMEVGRAFWIDSSLQYAAEETSRYIMVNRSAGNAEVSSYALSQLPGIDPDLVTVDVQRETVDGVEFVTVRTQYTFAVVAAIVPILPAALEGRSRTPLLE